MYAGLKPLWAAYAGFVGLTLAFLWMTGTTFMDWRVEATGVSAAGTVSSIGHCYNRGIRLATVYLAIQFVDTTGTSRVSQTRCEYDRYVVSQSIGVRYLPGDPDHILIPADIGAGQGPTLIKMMGVDAICVLAAVLGGVYGSRVARRNRERKTQRIRQQIEHMQPLDDDALAKDRR